MKRRGSSSACGRFWKRAASPDSPTRSRTCTDLRQLPGLAVQRLMADGYGYGAEGDWKHAALVRLMKVMSHGLDGGVSFMEDYTYHFHPSGHKVLGAHMLEICPSIASGKPSCEIHPLGIGGKEDPVRLVFDARPGPAVNASLVDMGNRFRLVVNKLDVVPPDQPLPKLPVARALWVPQPNLTTAAAAWILAGGAHHTSFAQALTVEHLEDYAEMASIELLVIGDETKLTEFKKELRWNEVYYHLHARLAVTRAHTNRKARIMSILSGLDWIVIGGRTLRSCSAWPGG